MHACCWCFSYWRVGYTNLLMCFNLFAVLAPQWKELSPGSEDDETEPDPAPAAAAADAELPADPSTLSASLLFYGVRGEQARDADAPSFYNLLEASTVTELVAGLVSSGAGVAQSDVGVMATYRRQVQAIRLMLRRKCLGAVRVGTVDDYQGQEERVVFISTVLSRAASLPSTAADADAQVALWRNPRRFNVAVTRAKALLVVVGHPMVLLEDSCWRELVRHCVARGAFRGIGAAAVRARLGVDAAPGGPLDPGNAAQLGLEEVALGGEEGAGAGGEAELAATIERLAELALLGGGDLDRLYPETMEEAYEAYAEETEWRVML